jgi:adenosylcobinamide amidohydrolase
MTREMAQIEWKRWQWLGTSEYAAFRHGRYIVVELLTPHRVLTTSPWLGGLSETATHLVNHQSCEASGHLARCEEINKLGIDGYHDTVCSDLGLVSSTTAVMGTAANMIYAAHEQTTFGELRVDVIVTAGVEGNAACAGDPARWIETPTGWNKVPGYDGTINTIVLVNQPLKAEAQVRSLITVTEGKTAALMELGVSSRYSQDLATGTGTDQVCIASPADSQRYSYTSASPHSKLGELLGLAVRKATKQALRWQNGLEPSYTRSLFHALRRFGFSEAAFLEAMSHRLAEASLLLIRKNLNAVLYEPQVAAAAYAFAGVLDRVRFGMLPASAGRDVLRQQAATLASSLSARPQCWSEFWRKLDVDTERPIEAVYDAVALGWTAKWTSPD